MIREADDACFTGSSPVSDGSNFIGSERAKAGRGDCKLLVGEFDSHGFHSKQM